MKIDFRTDILPLKNQLYRLALRITLDSAEAEDVVQETLIKVWNKRDTWEEIDNIEAFCFTVCRNLSLDSVKNKRSQTESLDDKPVEKPDNTFNPSDKVIEKDQVSIVREIIDSLPEKQRECIQLRDFERSRSRSISSGPVRPSSSVFRRLMVLRHGDEPHITRSLRSLYTTLRVASCFILHESARISTNVG